MQTLQVFAMLRLMPQQFPGAGASPALIEIPLPLSGARAGAPPAPGTLGSLSGRVWELGPPAGGAEAGPARRAGAPVRNPSAKAPYGCAGPGNCAR